MEEAKEAQGELIPKGDAEKETAALTELLRGITDPLAKSQEIAQKEETKRAEIMGKVATRFITYVFGVAVLVVFLAAAALWKGEIQLTEKIVFALLGFLGGFGFGRGISKDR